MEKELKALFINRWNKYFAKPGLPITYYYTNDTCEDELKESKNEHRCIICNLNRVRDGYTFVYSARSRGCSGGKRYAGFSKKLRSNFEYFLSCGIAGELEGERYKKTPELVKEYMKNQPPFEVPAKYLVFKRWDRLLDADEPVAVVFFALPDVLSGLFTLANYDTSDPNGVITPMGSGCSSIISYPLTEARFSNPRCVLGMFDVSGCIGTTMYT